MKAINLVKILSCALLVSTGVNAQTIYEAAKFSGSDLNGTARFVGMGGAMGALGADISTIGTNPAGIGLYRSNDIMTSFGFNNVSTKSNFNGSIMDASKFNGSFDNIGFVYSSKVGNETSLKYINFGFNYKKLKSFDRSFSMQGNLGQSSQTGQMANSSSDLSIKDLGAGNAFSNGDIGWLSAIGWNAGLFYPVNPNQDLQKYIQFPGYESYGNYYSKESGHIGAYDFNVSLNLSDRVYLGFTLGAYDLNYTKNTSYSEAFTGSDFRYQLNSFASTKGTGIDIKAGVIVRPLEDSPFRIGASFASPIFYKLTLNSGAILTSNTREKDGKPILVPSFDMNTYNEVGDCITDYQLQTPWKYNLSMGYTIGQSVAIGAEYEYQDFSTSKLLDNDGVKKNFENDLMKNMLQGVHTLRLGAEVKLVPEFALRAGYNYSSAAYKDNSYKLLPLNSVRTDTDYSNEKSINNYTLGLGYKASNFYADIAYQYSAYKEDFRAFDIEDLPMTKGNNDKQQVIVTLGYRF